MAKNLQEFSTLHQHVKGARSRLALPGVPEAFPFVLLPLIVGLREDEVEATITDKHFQKIRGRPSGHDRGTDAIHIETDGTDSTIHIFNLKYKADFDRTEAFFPRPRSTK